MDTLTNGSHLVTGLFNNKNSADSAYQSLQQRGYTSDKIHLIMSDDTRNTHFKHEVVKTEMGSKAMEGAGTGSAIGGTVGAVAAAVAAIGTNLLLPGLGLVIAGPLAAALAGAGAGGLTGGIVGALVGSGIPKERAEIYEKGVKEGRIVIGVHARDAAEVMDIENDLRAHNAHDIHS